MAASLFLALLLGAAAVADGSTVTPVQKVVQMMTDMLAKGKAEMEDEQVRFAAYQTFCKDTSSEKGYAISTGKDAIDQLSADVDKATADASQLSRDITGLDNDVSTWEADKAEATRLRHDEHAVFQVTHEDYTEAISAVDRALKTLKAGPGQSLLQAQQTLSKVGDLNLVPAHAKKAIMAFLESGPDNALIQDAEKEMQPQATEKNYVGASDGVVAMVEQLGDKFDDERDALEKTEANSRHAFDMMNQDLVSQIANGKDERDTKAASKAKRDADRAEAAGGLVDTTATVKADEKFLVDLTQECEMKAADFGKRQELRAGEIEAINKAIEIMGSDSISGGTQHLPSLVQQKSVSLAQFRANNQNAIQGRVASFLLDQAERTHSRILSLVALKVKDDPFKKVTKMITDMITKLTEEANEEAEHKGFCDSEMSSNKQTRDTKTEESDTLRAERDQLTADISSLSQDISDLSAAIAAIDRAVSEATSLRQNDKSKNTATIADAKAASGATEKALGVLREFYAKAAEATALTQVKQPETFDTPYKGMGGSGGGVVSMLEVIQSDFQRLESETTTSEAEAANSYGEFMADSSADKEAKTADVKHKSNTKTNKESALASATKNLKEVSEELQAAFAYFDKLKPSCVDAGVSYAERVQRREEEIASLKEALNILGSEQ